VANGQQFFDRVNHTDFMTASFQQTRHDGDGELFAAADQRGIDAVRALTQQADTVQDMFNLSKLLLDEGFQLCKRESGLRVGKALQQFSKNAFSVGNIGRASWPPMVFSIIATRWLVIFAGADRTVATCPCLALLSRISATRRKRSAFATDVPPNFNTRMVLTP
jgi:hypothetical protein